MQYRLRIESTHTVNIQTGAEQPTPVVEHDQLYATFDEAYIALGLESNPDASGGIRQSLDRITITREAGE